MMRYLTSAIRALTTVALVAVLVHPLLAQQRAQQPRPAPVPRADTADTPDPQPRPDAQSPQPRPAGQAPRPAQPSQPPCDCASAGGRPVNLQIELTITDQTGSEAAAENTVEKKTVSMIVADRALGRIRASGIVIVREGATNARQLRLNVDGRPVLQPNDSIRLELTLEYEALPPGQAPDTPRMTSPLNESLTVILQPGKPLTISRAADPTADRRVTVDVTATILK
jgi:hypothetical protein